MAILQLSALALCLGLILWWAYPKAAVTVPQVQLSESVSTTTSPIFDAVNIEAKSAYVYDTVTKKVIFDRNSDLQLPLASLTKVMTALAVSNLLSDRDVVTITQSDLSEDGDTGLVPNEEWSVKDLLDFSLIVSSNDGARALASVAGAFLGPTSSTSAVEAFVGNMNSTAKGLGLTETYFLNPSGLDASETLAGGYGSAKDMALLVDHILRNKPHLLEATSFDRLRISSGLAAHEALNTNKAIDMIPNVIASKTGYTDLAGGNLVVAFDAGVAHPIIIAVLGSSFDGRFQDMAQLVSSTLDYLAQK
ncbi:MAG: serine hydrolase [Candidatus Paceibacterota bacterium]